MAYEFKKQLETGRAGEWVMDKYHAPLYTIKTATMAEEKSGIDRLYKSKSSGMIYTVEIKTDFMSHKTGHLLWEIISNDKTGKAGWAYTMSATVLIYYRWYAHEVLYYSPQIVKDRIDWWTKCYRNVQIQNDGYQTHGVLMPVDVAKKTAWAIRKPVDPHWMKENYKEWLKK